MEIKVLTNEERCAKWQEMRKELDELLPKLKEQAKQMTDEEIEEKESETNHQLVEIAKKEGEYFKIFKQNNKDDKIWIVDTLQEVMLNIEAEKASQINKVYSTEGVYRLDMRILRRTMHARALMVVRGKRTGNQKMIDVNTKEILQLQEEYNKLAEGRCKKLNYFIDEFPKVQKECNEMRGEAKND